MERREPPAPTISILVFTFSFATREGGNEGEKEEEEEEEERRKRKEEEGGRREPCSAAHRIASPRRDAPGRLLVLLLGMIVLVG